MIILPRFFGPSRQDREDARQQALLQLIREERAASAAREAETLKLMTQLVASVASQSNVFSDYLKLIGSAPAPVVRTMNDAEEAEFERIREARSASTPLTTSTPSNYQFTPDSLPDLDDVLAQVKAGLL